MKQSLCFCLFISLFLEDEFHGIYGFLCCQYITLANYSRHPCGRLGTNITIKAQIKAARCHFQLR